MFDFRISKFFSALLFSALLLSSCGPIYNSSSSDFARYGTDVTGSSNFLAARFVMVAQCFNCHSNWATWSEAAFVANNFVIARDLTGSKLYTRIRGNEVNSTGNMPPTGILTTQEVEAISTWISTM